ncbi:MAG: tetratricopeptide repeat protein [Gammaproteobacteria bacterium]|jgi:tetratricopeptide (TPR) repeat protein|nr:tetratricopeptide repeat protein [Gammaproteobacteria bacterium]
MAMSRIPKTLVFALLSLSAANVHALDVKLNTPPARSEQDIAEEYVELGQVVPVAEEGVDEGAEDYSVPEPGDADALAREFELFKQLLQDGVLDEADTVAKRVVELAIRSRGPQSNEYAKALTNLAIVQHRTEQYDAAQQNFQAAIDIIEDNEDRLNAQLINPLKGLGAAQLESGRPDLAATTFRRAVHVTHVNEGPHNLDQLELLESIAETWLRMGDLELAKDAQDTIYALNIRKHELDSLDLVPSLMRRGAWQHRAGFINDERATYRRAIRIIEARSAKDDLQLVEPLIMLGKSHFYIDTSGTDSFHDVRTSTAEIYFRRAARIAAEHPDSNWQIIAQASLALGDYYMYDNNPQRGRQTYRTVWNLLSEDESRLNVRHEQLERIVPLRLRKLPQYINASDQDGGEQGEDPLLQGKITMTYEISTRGRITELKMIEADPPEFTNMQRHVQRELRQRLFRPRFEEAEAVPTPELQLVHAFYYRQSDLDAARAAAAADERN